MEKEIKKEFQNLGRMIKKGFDEVDKRFEQVDKKLDVLEQGHEEIRLRQDKMVYRFEFEKLERQFDKHSKKIELSWVWARNN